MRYLPGWKLQFGDGHYWLYPLPYWYVPERCRGEWLHGLSRRSTEFDHGGDWLHSVSFWNIQIDVRDWRLLLLSRWSLLSQGCNWDYTVSGRDP